MIPAEAAKKLQMNWKFQLLELAQGTFTSGQVLVFHDLLGLNKNFNPKFVRKYLDGYDLIKTALNNFNKDIKEEKFPGINESY